MYQFPLVRLPVIDVNGFVGFCLFPADVGKAGQIDYLVSADKVLTGGNQADFTYLMQGLVNNGVQLSLEKTVALYCRFYTHQNALVLTADDDAYFPGRDGFFEKVWVAPVFEQNAKGVDIDCWVLNTDRLEPFRLSGSIFSNGECAIQIFQ